MPNAANIEKVIKLIEAADPERCQMRLFAAHSTCGTAYCLGGWTRVAMREADGDPLCFYPQYEVYNWLGLTPLADKILDDERFPLFYLSNLDGRAVKGPHGSLSDFDELDPSLRKSIMLTVLRLTRDGHQQPWTAAFKAHDLPTATTWNL